MYIYKRERANIFKDHNHVTFLQVRDKTLYYLKEHGVIRVDAVLKGITGDSWVMLASFDYMVEIGELKEINVSSKQTPANHRIFIRGEKE